MKSQIHVEMEINMSLAKKKLQEHKPLRSVVPSLHVCHALLTLTALTKNHGGGLSFRALCMPHSTFGAGQRLAHIVTQMCCVLVQQWLAR